MKSIARLAFLVAAGLLLEGCAGSQDVAGATSAPLTVQETEGSDISRLTLSDKALERLGIETVAVAEELVDGSARLVIPYAAILYAADGSVWTYTNPEGLLFVRAPITVDRIDGNVAILAGGPPAGTLVVTVGGSELWGAEHGVGGGH